MEEEEQKVVKDVKNDTAATYEELLLRIDIAPEHESPTPLSPPPTSDAASKYEELLIFLVMLHIILIFPLVFLVLGASAFFGIRKKPGSNRISQRYLGEWGMKLEEFLEWRRKPGRKRISEKVEEFLGKAGYLLLLILLVILSLPLFLFFLPLFFFFGIHLLDDNAERGKKPGTKKGIYEKVEEFLDPAVRLAKWVPIIRNRVSLLILLWLIINLSVVGLRKKNVLGSKLWKWTLLIVILSCGYHAISIFIHLCLYFLELICKDKKEVLYYAKGLRRSINMVILSCSLLLIWQFYFRSDHGLKQTSGSDKVFDLGTRTLISLLIFALLWLLKSILLLKWEAHVVYERFLDRILRAGFQVYFLALMSGKSWEIFRPEGNSDLSGEATIPEGNKTEKQRKAKGSQESYEENKNGAEDIPLVGNQQKQEGVPNDDNNNVQSGDSTAPEGNKAEKQMKTNGNEGSHEENRKRAKDILHVEEQEHMLSKNVSTYAIQEMAKYFVALKVLSREGGDATTGIFAKFELLCDEEMKPLYKKLQVGDSLETFLHWIVESRLLLFRDRDYVTKELRRDRFKLNEKDAGLLYKQLLQDGESKVSYGMFKDWVMKALNNCLTLGQTLLDAKEVVNCLKHILNCLVFAIFILSWLLLTEIATTKVLVLIASPLLSASFIFGGTCKTLFEGIIFAFINHPFDVGDQCVIDGIEMEVKDVNILTTTFVKMGTKEVALYPNSVLAAKAIVNRKLEPDPNDTVELSLDCSIALFRKRRIDELEKKIKHYINQSDKFKGPGHVTVKHIGNNDIKIVVHFQHSMSIFDATHSQCSEKKNKQRSEFLLQIIDYLNEPEEKGEEEKGEKEKAGEEKKGEEEKGEKEKGGKEKKGEEEKGEKEKKGEEEKGNPTFTIQSIS